MVITVPKGGYAPTFEFRIPDQKPARPLPWVPALVLATAVLAILFGMAFLQRSRPTHDALAIPRLVIAPFLST